MNRRHCEWRLLMLWCAGAAAVFVVLLMQHLGHAFDGDAARAWGWYSATVMSTPALLLGSYLSGKDGDTRMEPAMFRFVFCLSAFYVLLLVVSVSRFGFQNGQTALDLLADSTLYLGPVQGFVSLAFGRLFGAAEAGAPKKG
jgi:hypothetical protein